MTGAGIFLLAELTLLAVALGAYLARPRRR
jgi:hypothetical protein